MKQTIYTAIGINENDSFISIGDKPGNLMPLVFMGEKMLPDLLRLCRQLSLETGKHIVVAKFELEQVIEQFKGA